jgi:phosphoribosylamine--glycine ligase
MPARVLIVGGGAREHALAWALQRSPQRPLLFAAPGNAGMARLCERWPIGADELGKLADRARAEKIDLVVVGPEAPLCAGLADLLAATGIPVFGPSRAAAELEGSKAFCKALLRRHAIPTATFGTFSMLPEAELFIDSQAAEGARRLVVKADGLAAGKGVVLCDSPDEAKRAARELIATHKGSIVVEEFLVGREASVMALVVDEAVVPLPPAEDHKTIFDGDRGPMTGGMGVVCPTPVVDDVTARRILDEVLRPTARALCSEGRPFRGLLFAGVMIGPTGPKVLEFNCRFGDPETEAVLVRLAEGERGDLLAALTAVARGEAPRSLAFTDTVSTTVVMAQAGYPGPLAPPVRIDRLDEAEAVPGVVVFHAGTRQEGEALVSAGGRVLAVTAVGADASEARARAYRAADLIEMPGAQLRRDIGARSAGLPRTE